MATDDSFATVVRNGSVNATKDSDYTVKVIAGGLNSNTQYFYQFIVPNGSTISPTGKFRYTSHVHSYLRTRCSKCHEITVCLLHILSADRSCRPRQPIEGRINACIAHNLHFLGCS